MYKTQRRSGFINLCVCVCVFFFFLYFLLTSYLALLLLTSIIIVHLGYDCSLFVLVIIIRYLPWSLLFTLITITCYLP
jgi:hypothetical protein